MSVLNELSSAVGDQTEEANRRVAARCLESPSLLDEIALGLSSDDADLVGDCAEVFTKVAEANPALIVPYAEALVAQRAHRKARVRWEVMHALALTAARIPSVIRPLLPELQAMIARDASTIARDHTVDTVSQYAGTGADAARAAYPILLEALTAWNGKHAARALRGLGQVARAVPALRDDVIEQAQRYMTHDRAVIRKEAKALFKALTS